MSSARRASSSLRLSPSAVPWSRASVFPVGSSRFGLVGGVGCAPVSSGACASELAPGPCGPGGVLSAVLVTACVPSASSVGACGCGIVGWGPWCCALVGASACGACPGGGVEAGLAAR